MKPSKEPLLTALDIATRTSELADTISTDYTGRELLLLPVLKGGLIFAADLMRLIKVPLTLDFIRARSYQGTRSQGGVEFLVHPTEPIEGRHLLIVEDIVDTGRTTAAILDLLQAEKPATISLCTLLDKPASRQANVEPNYAGFQIADHFVVGYGLDYNERYRELPAIHILEEE